MNMANTNELTSHAIAISPPPKTTKYIARGPCIHVWGETSKSAQSHKHNRDSYFFLIDLLSALMAFHATTAYLPCLCCTNVSDFKSLQWLSDAISQWLQPMPHKRSCPSPKSPTSKSYTVHVSLCPTHCDCVSYSQIQALGHFPPHYVANLPLVYCVAVNIPCKVFSSISSVFWPLGTSAVSRLTRSLNQRPYY